MEGLKTAEPTTSNESLDPKAEREKAVNELTQIVLKNPDIHAAVLAEAESLISSLPDKNPFKNTDELIAWSKQIFGDALPVESLAALLESDKSRTRRDALYLLSGMLPHSKARAASRFLHALEHNRNASPHGDFARTILETYLVAAAQGLIGYVAYTFTPIRTGSNAFTTEEGKKKLDDYIQNHPVQILFGSASMGVAEEFLYRGLGSRYVDKKYGEGERGLKPRELHMKEGAAISAIFAVMHNVINLDTKGIPLHQFLEGLFLWYLARKRGLNHAMLSHALTNASGVGGLIVLNKMQEAFPEP